MFNATLESEYMLRKALLTYATCNGTSQGPENASYKCHFGSVKTGYALGVMKISWMCTTILRLSIKSSDHLINIIVIWPLFPGTFQNLL